MKQNSRQRIRFVILGLVLVLGAFWAGSHWGPKEPSSVQARPELALPPASGSESA